MSAVDLPVRDHCTCVDQAGDRVNDLRRRARLSSDHVPPPVQACSPRRAPASGVEIGCDDAGAHLGEQRGGFRPPSPRPLPESLLQSPPCHGPHVRRPISSVSIGGESRPHVRLGHRQRHTRGLRRRGRRGRRGRLEHRQLDRGQRDQARARPGGSPGRPHRRGLRRRAGTRQSDVLTQRHRQRHLGDQRHVKVDRERARRHPRRRSGSAHPTG